MSDPTVAAILGEIDKRKGRCESGYDAETCLTAGLALRDTCDACLLASAARLLRQRQGLEAVVQRAAEYKCRCVDTTCRPCLACEATNALRAAPAQEDQ